MPITRSNMEILSTRRRHPEHSEDLSNLQGRHTPSSQEVLSLIENIHPMVGGGAQHPEKTPTLQLEEVHSTRRGCAPSGWTKSPA